MMKFQIFFSHYIHVPGKQQLYKLFFLHYINSYNIFNCDAIWLSCIYGLTNNNKNQHSLLNHTYLLPNSQSCKCNLLMFKPLMQPTNYTGILKRKTNSFLNWSLKNKSLNLSRLWQLRLKSKNGTKTLKT